VIHKEEEAWNSDSMFVVLAEQKVRVSLVKHEQPPMIPVIEKRKGNIRVPSNK
jgi:hypothetical protein